MNKIAPVKSTSAAIARVNTFAFSGIDAVPVEVQVQISPGTPALMLVGLPDKAVGEAKDRVRAAFTAIGLALPPRRVLINLRPADLLKEGSHFDLPLALAILAAMDVLPRDEIAGKRDQRAIGFRFGRTARTPHGYGEAEGGRGER